MVVHLARNVGVSWSCCCTHTQDEPPKSETQEASVVLDDEAIFKSAGDQTDSASSVCAQPQESQASDEVEKQPDGEKPGELPQSTAEPSRDSEEPNLDEPNAQKSEMPPEMAISEVSSCRDGDSPISGQASAKEAAPKKIKKTASQIEKEKKREEAEARVRASQKRRASLIQRAEVMRDNNPGENLCRLARDGKVKILQRLLEVRASPTSTDSKGCFALLEACRTGSTEVAKLLVEAKTDPNKSGVLTDGQTTALHVAAKFNHVDILKLLLDNGGSLTVKNWRYQVPLEVAQQFKALDAIQTIEKRGKSN